MSGKNVALTLDGKNVTVTEGTTILKAAEESGITIPIICYHDRLDAPGLCRQCVVEVEGARRLLPACITKVRDGMVVKTDTENVRRVRRTNLEMLAAHSDISDSEELDVQLRNLGADVSRFVEENRREYPVLDDNPFYIRDYTRCILCQRCVQVCSADIQFSYALVSGGRGYMSRITTFYDKELPLTTCVFCGNCIEVCPTGALITRNEYLMREGTNND